jgi:hypothetical protein
VYLPEQLTLYRRHPKNSVGVSDLWNARSALRYFLSPRRKDLFRRDRDRIDLYLDRGMFSDGEEKAYLEDLREHYSILTAPGVHGKAFWLIFKHRKKVFTGLSPFATSQYLFGRLMTF